MESLVSRQLVDEAISEAIKIYRDYPRLSYYDAINKAKTIFGVKGECLI